MVLNDLKAYNSMYKNNYKLLAELPKCGISKTTISKRMSNSRIQQIVTLLYLAKKLITSKGILKYQSKNLKELKDRIEHNIDYYDKNLLVKVSLSFLNKIIDNWYNISI